MGIAEKIIQFTLAKKDYPTHVGHIVNLSLLDWLSVSLAAQNEPVSRVVRSCFMEEGGNPEAFVFGSDQKISSRSAALINGTISHALDYDDTHFLFTGHPTASAFPTALAIGEELNSTIDEMILAYMCGVEVSTRLGHILGYAHYNKGFHQTATSGAFGATVVASKMLKLNLDQIENAFGIVSTRASGLKSQFGTMGKPFHAGIAASNGIEAAKLAKLGFISCEDGIECSVRKKNGSLIANCYSESDRMGKRRWTIDLK